MNNSSTAAGNHSHPLHRFLSDHPTLRFIRMQWVDLSGVLRTRIVPRGHCLRLASEGRFIGVAYAGMLFPVSKLQPAMLPAAGTMELHPDWQSIRPTLYAPGHASVMCFTDARVQGVHNPRGLCPRTLLARTLEQAKESHGLDFLIGFEVEFLLLDPVTLDVPTSEDPVEDWSMTTGLRGSTLTALEEITHILEESSIVVQQFHTESKFQIEISTGPLPPMEAIDALMYTHETVKTVFSRYKLRATMAPNAWPKGPTTGAHAHISINRPEDDDSFLAGMLEDLPAISTFGLSNYDSFVRTKDFINGAGTWVSWGTQNRDVPIRKVEPGHWELRCVDATANFYLVIFLILNAGIKGLSERCKLTLKDCVEFPTHLGRAKLAELGIDRRLPMSLRESIELLKADTDIAAVIGQDLKREYVKLKEVDEVAFGEMSDEERRRRFVRMF